MQPKTFTALNLMHQYLSRADWKVRENSNMAFSLQGLNNYISTEVTKQYWLDEIYSQRVALAHEEGDLHMHDLGLLSTYCVGWDLMDLLIEGFTGAEGKTTSKPPKHFRAALGQVVNFFYTLQGEAAGAQAFSSFDTLLAPFIRQDNLSYREVKQALQEFVFNLNVATRVGFQTPFTNLAMDLVVPSTYVNRSAIVGGTTIKETYAEFQPEMLIINQALLEVMGEGDAHGRVFTFPILTYNITKEFNWDMPELAPLWEATAKYGLPYFSNFINSDLNPEDARSMCCRLRLETKDLEMKGGGLFGANPLTGSIGVVTLNMPRIGYLATSLEDFYQRIAVLMDVAKESLESKREIIEYYTEHGLYPYTQFYLRAVKEQTGRYWANHFSTIGLVGMNECCENLLGKDITTPEGMKLALDVLDFMRDAMRVYKKQTGNNYNLEATPAEGTAFRLALLDKERYPLIVTAGDEIPYYTNSTHLPVQYTDDIFEELTLQDPLQTKYTGGTVVHLFLGERVREGETVKELVRTICENFHLPYFTLSPSFSVCPNHGYVVGSQPICNHCGASTEVYSRVVGYLRPVKQWNDGKQAEFGDRKTYQIYEATSTQI